MKTNIYYFSGTGNSLAIADLLARELEGQVAVIPIAGLTEERQVVVQADILGFVCPTYFLNIPGMMRSFIQRLTFRSTPYIFAVVTCNGQPGRGLHVMGRLLRRKGQSMKLGYAVDMPGNSLIGMDFTNPPEVRQKRLDESVRAIGVIARAVRERRTAARTEPIRSGSIPAASS